MKKQNLFFIIFLFLIYPLLNGCVSSNESQTKPYIGVWSAQIERYFPEVERNITMQMDVSILENKTFVASGKARLVEGDPETTIFTKSGSYQVEGSILLLSALNCSYYDGNSLKSVPCEDPISTIEIIITDKVWTWIEEDGFTINLVKQ